MPLSLQSVYTALISVQIALPFRLPNEQWAWWRYNKKFSEVCDSCNNERSSYVVSYRDPMMPSTVLMPIPVRLCTNCLCDADTEVGVFEDGDTGNGGSFPINRI